MLPPNVFPYSPRYLYFISYLILLFFILSHVLLASASAAFVFHSIAINANGLSDPMKIAALSSMTRSAKPHILIIGETKSVHRVSSRLTIPDYDFHENPGQPAVGTCNCGKWGIIVGVRCGLFNVQPLQLHPSLDGRVLALDLIIPTTEGGGFTHRLIGIYAPWDPGNQDSNFWHSLSTLCSSSPFSWSVHGDFNATLSFAESSSTAPQIDNSRQAYSAFLQETNGLDLWWSQPDYSLQNSFTYQACQCRPGQQTPLLIQSTIDRVATSQHGILSAHIHVLTNFIPCTDHRPILSSIILSAPATLHGQPSIPHPIPASVYTPRFLFRHHGEKERLLKFSDVIHCEIQKDPTLLTEMRS